MKTTAPKNKIEIHSLQRGDILFTPSSETAEEIGVSAVVMEELENVVYSYHLVRLRPQIPLVTKFSKYFCNHSGVLQQFSALSKGTTRKILTRDNFKSIEVVIPSLAEQHAIADFLNHHTAKIDALIEKQERLNVLLEEKCSALIARAVTKGLDPGVPMKDSGIPSIGMIPKHWRVEKNKRLFYEYQNYSENGDEELLTVSHKTGISPRKDKQVYMFLAESLVGYKKCFEGDLIINTMWAWMGALGFSSVDGIVSPSYHVYRLKNSSEFNINYIDFLYRTPEYITEINRYSKGVWKSRLRLYPSNFLDMFTLVPPKNEQDIISERIKTNIKKSETIINNASQSISLLKEYRASMITSAVTGKIDLRDIG